MKNNFQVRVEIPQPIHDSAGNPTTLDGTPVWQVSDDTLVELIPDADGMGALIKGRGPVGSVNLVVEGDADLGSGVKPVFWSGSLTIEAGDAVGGVLTFKEPEEQPAP